MRTLSWLVIWIALGSAGGAALAQQAYPVKPVRLIVPYPPSGGNDILARIVAERLSERLGQQIVVDNRGGAATVIGTEIAARAPADGYTLLLATVTTLAVNPNLKRALPYDAERDFVPVTMLASQPYLLVVHPGIKVGSARDLIALAKAKPGALNFASPGVGSNGHLAGELMKSMAGIDMVHVGYKGTGPALNDLVAGHVSLMFATMSSVESHVKAKRLNGIAVSTLKRSPAMPAVPTLAESALPGYSMRSWNGLLFPRGTPPAAVGQVNNAVNAVLQDAQFRQRLVAIGYDPDPSTPQEFARFVRDEKALYARVVKAAGLKPE
jgi:tripartite-type tricarboxylate transporter receptor subunit TctC